MPQYWPNETGIATVIDNKVLKIKVGLGLTGIWVVVSTVRSSHRFAHALGLDKHFDGFGDGDVFNNHAKSC